VEVDSIGIKQSFWWVSAQQWCLWPNAGPTFLPTTSNKARTSNYGRPHGARVGHTPYERLKQKTQDPLS
jgi:hypothetical protein